MTNERLKSMGLVIIGAQKSGTTSLKRYLAQHPDIFFHAKNEMPYFLPDEEYALGYDHAFFRHYSEYADEAVLGAKYVDIIFSGTALDRLNEHNPNVKIVVILRNPVDRAYSAYWFCRRMGWERNRNVREALLRPLDPSCRPMSTSWHCAYLARGHYHDQLTEVFTRFKEEQVSAFRFEELQQDPLSVCNQVFKDCGVDSGFTPDVSKIHNRARLSRSGPFSRLLVDPSQAKRRWRWLLPEPLRLKIKKILLRLNTLEFEVPPIDQGLRKELVEYFRPHNSRLGRLLDRDFSDWNR